MSMKALRQIFFKLWAASNSPRPDTRKANTPIDAIFASADLNRTGVGCIELPSVGGGHARAQAKICVTIPKWGIWLEVLSCNATFRTTVLSPGPGHSPNATLRPPSNS